MQLLKDNIFYYILKSFRPKQWTKNFFVFAAILFSQNIFNMGMFTNVISIFIIFCFLSSSVYLINDVIDVERDKNHPKKKNRPIAAGKLSKGFAVTLAGLLSIACIVISFSFNYYTGVVSLIYLIQATFYSLYFKNIVILDILFIAFGFVLRVIVGGLVISVNISVWLLICIILLSLFLALCKRRHEISLLSLGAKKHRKILEDYSVELIDQMISIVTASTLVVYSLYTFMASSNKLLMLTIPFVLYGVFRYLYLVYKKDGGGEPEEIVLKDKPLMLNILLWVLTIFFTLYTNTIVL